jgi:HEAT repeat protein
VETRFYVTYLLSELVYPEAVALLATRLQDKDNEVRRIAALTLGKFREMDQFPGVLLDLRADLQNPDPRPRRAAIEALAALGDAESVPPLIKLLADPDQVVVETAVNALVTLTKQDLARNEKRWQAWWERNSHRHRLEWLIDGLVHKAPDIRSAAIAELEQLTGLTFGYSFDMPRREREGIRRRFVDWWAEVGIEQFR